MLEVSHVTKRYKKLVANNDISFRIPEGNTALLVGPNGAGKSTLFKSIMGLLRYDGRITLNGNSNKSVAAKQQLGYVPEIPALYPLLTVAEHMEFMARLYKVEDWEERSRQLLDRFEMTDKKNKLGSELSKGMQQKVSICAALLPKPALILFDEPMIGLDPHAIKELKSVFGELKAEGSSLFISTHILDSVDEIWDSVMIMMNGSLVTFETRENLDSQGRTLEDLFFSVTEAKDREGMSEMAELADRVAGEGTEPAQDAGPADTDPNSKGS